MPAENPMTTAISLEKISIYRSKTFRTQLPLRLQTFKQAVDFVIDRGFIFFWPNKGVILPSLWNAVAGDRPVPDQHDDPGHITWDWKDKSLGKKLWYYGRVIANRNAMISLGVAPFFYALSPNYGSPTEDYLEQYAAGKLTAEAKNIFEILLDNGPLDTLELRRKAHLSSEENESRFAKAISTLQMEFKILPTGISPVGAWKYAFIYDLTHRQFPDLPSKAQKITESSAIRFLILQYLSAVGTATFSQIGKILRYPAIFIHSALEKLVASGEVIYPCTVENQRDLHYALPVMLYNQ